MGLGIALNRSRQVPAEESPAFGAIAERFRRAGELDRAAALCQEGLQRYPDHLSARVTLGWALLDLGRHEEARGELERVLRRAPDNLAAIRGLAELHDRTENADASNMQGTSHWLPLEADPPAAQDAVHHFAASSPVALQEADESFAFAAPPPPRVPISVPVPASVFAAPDPVEPEPFMPSAFSETDELGFTGFSGDQSSAPVESFEAVRLDGDRLDVGLETVELDTSVFETADLASLDLGATGFAGSDALIDASGLHLAAEAHTPVAFAIADREPFLAPAAAQPSEDDTGSRHPVSTPGVVVEPFAPSLSFLGDFTEPFAPAEPVAAGVAVSEEIPLFGVNSAEPLNLQPPVEIAPPVQVASIPDFPIQPVVSLAVRTAPRAAATPQALAALERFLRKAEARKVEVLTRSVAS